MGFGGRLRKKREELGLSQEELANKTGVSRNTIMKFEKGSLPQGENLVALCRALQVSADWLLFGLGEAYGADGPGVVTDHGLGDPEGLPRLPEAGRPEGDLYALVPLAEARLSAGGGAFVPSEKASKFLAFRRDWLGAYATSPSQAILMSVQGESMSPTIMDGDLVMMDVGRRLVHDGGIYAIGLGDAISIKRLELLVGGRVRVISDNRQEYPPYEVDQAELRILGRIIWYARELIR
jgi:phage repressor protein C with HTH and peptisase S24 domain